MKPKFALTLSVDGIGLLHRSSAGWALVGEVSLDTADLADALRGLREKALMLEPEGVSTKLVLPNEQLKYLTIAASDDPGDAARKALDGATPYAVDDLAFDWVAHEDRIEVAAVAVEMLAEAEAFAQEHGFNPISFVGRPLDGQFAGEPFFGATEVALAQGISEDRIISDQSAVQVSKPTIPPAPDPTSEPAEPPADQAPDEEAQTNTAAPDDATEAEAAAPVAAFSSIRATRSTAQDRAAAPLEGATREGGPPRVTLRPIEEESLDDTSPPRVTGISASALPMEDVSPPVAPSTSIPPAPKDGLAPPEKLPEADFAESFAASASEPSSEAEASGTSFFSRRSRGAPATAGTPATALDEPQDERARMTIFGAREKAGVGGKPRFLGLILTVILLLFLIGVAAWASLFLDDGLTRFFRDDREPAMAALPDPEPEPATEAAPVEQVSLQPDQPRRSVRDDPATEILSRVTPEDLSPDAALARYAATGIWQLAPQPPAEAAARELEDFHQTTLDPEPDFGDAVALPAAPTSRLDSAMRVPPPPPAADVRFILDDRGLVLASPEGALTPEGVRVFAGLPEVSLPDALQQRPEPRIDVPEEISPEARAQLALLRPNVRPEDVEEQIERSGLSGRTRSELAGLRPEARPQSAQEAAAEAAAQVDPDSLEAAVEQAVAQPDPFAGAASQAVRTSLKPNTRPSDFASIVQRAEETAQTQAEAQTETQAEAQTQAQAQTAQVATTQRVAPNIPSSANVARAATETNALQFERVNLIGVYGTQSNRRALVRTSNGRYHKVKVGDRLDGGRVNAIGDGELSYQKGGRNIILQMPSG